MTPMQPLHCKISLKQRSVSGQYNRNNFLAKERGSDSLFMMVSLYRINANRIVSVNIFLKAEKNIKHFSLSLSIFFVVYKILTHWMERGLKIINCEDDITTESFIFLLTLYFSVYNSTVKIKPSMIARNIKNQPPLCYHTAMWLRCK